MLLTKKQLAILFLIGAVPGLLVGLACEAEAKAESEVCFTPHVRNHPTNPFFCGESKWNMKSK